MTNRRPPGRSVARRAGPALLSLAVAVALAATRAPAASGGRPREPDRAEDRAAPVLDWEELPALPGSRELAGVFAGASGGALLVAGGVAFGDGAGEEPGAVRDAVFLLREPRAEWERRPLRLPRPLAHGVAASWSGRLVCAGGTDGTRHRAEAFTLRWTGERVVREGLPVLPAPAAFASGAVVGDTLYVAAGRRAPRSERSAGGFWALDLAAAPAAREWRELPPCPGAPRELAVAGAQGGDFFLVSGYALESRGPGTDARMPLADAWRFDPGAREWTELAPPPRPCAAAPSPAAALGAWHLAVVGGDDGTRGGGKEGDGRPGEAPPQVLVFDTVTGAWTGRGRLPEGLVRHPGGNGAADAGVPGGRVSTSAVAEWQGLYVVPERRGSPDGRSARFLGGRPVPPHAAFGAANWTVLVLYLLFLVGLGGYFARRERTTEDFFLGGRRVPWWAAGVSIFATQLSAITYLAIPAKAYASDWSYILVNFGIVLVAPLVVFVYLPFFRRLDVTTAYEYLERRFHASVRVLGSLAFAVFQLGRMGIVILLPALALSAVTGIDVYVCIVGMGLLSTLYTAAGGIEAVIWTDVLQVVVLVGGALAVLALTASGVDGGPAALLSTATEDGKLRLARLEPSWTTDAVGVVLVGGVFNALVPYTSDQAVVQRYLTTSSEARAARAVWTNAALVVPASFLFFGIGTALYGYYTRHPGLLAPLEKSDQILPWFIAQEMPAGLAGLVIAGVFAAAMSSFDSSVHAVSTVVTTDLVRRFRPGGSERGWLAVARRWIAALGVLGTIAASVLAAFAAGSLWDAFFAIVGLLGGTLGGLFALGIFVRRAGTGAAWTGAVASVAVLAGTRFGTELHGLLYAAVGVTGCVVAGALASLVLPGPRREPVGLTVHALGRGLRAGD